MSRTRYNSFNQVHKGLRAFLYDTALKLQQTDLTDKGAAHPVMEQLDALLAFFENHAHHEDHYFNEPLEKLNPRIAALFEKEHVEDHRLATVLQDLLEDWTAAITGEMRGKIGLRIFYAFNEFMAFNLYHMNKEEIELNRALWENYTDEQIKTTEQQLIQSIPPQKMMVSMKWMLRGINDKEAIHWIKGIKDHAPAQIYAIVTSMAEQELEPRRWNKIGKALEGDADMLEFLGKAS